MASVGTLEESKPKEVRAGGVRPGEIRPGVKSKSDPEPEYYPEKPDPKGSGYEPDEYVEYE